MKKTERFMSYSNQSKDLIKNAFNEALTEALYNKSACDLRSITEKLITLLELKETTHAKDKLTAPETDREGESVTEGVPDSNPKRKRSNNSNSGRSLQVKSTK